MVRVSQILIVWSSLPENIHLSSAWKPNVTTLAVCPSKDAKGFVLVEVLQKIK